MGLTISTYDEFCIGFSQFNAKWNEHKHKSQKLPKSLHMWIESVHSISRAAQRYFVSLEKDEQALTNTQENDLYAASYKLMAIATCFIENKHRIDFNHDMETGLAIPFIIKEMNEIDWITNIVVRLTCWIRKVIAHITRSKVGLALTKFSRDIAKIETKLGTSDWISLKTQVREIQQFCCNTCNTHIGIEITRHTENGTRDATRRICIKCRDTNMPDDFLPSPRHNMQNCKIIHKYHK